MVKVTTKQQFKVLVRQMEANPVIARGERPCGENKAVKEEVWRRIAENLNSCGPPRRTPEEWQRVWIHFKAKIKKKISNNKLRCVTGGGLQQEGTLSSLEQAVVKLMKKQITVNPARNDLGVFDIEESLESEPKITKEQPKIDTRQKSTERIRSKDQRINPLNHQNDTETDLLNTLKKIEEHLREVKDIKRKKYEVLKDIRDIKKKKFEMFVEEQTSNRKIKEKKLQVLKEQIHNLEMAVNDAAADDPPAGIYAKNESSSVGDVCSENTVMDDDRKAKDDVIDEITVDKSGWYIIDEFIPGQK